MTKELKDIQPLGWGRSDSKKRYVVLGIRMPSGKGRRIVLSSSDALGVPTYLASKVLEYGGAALSAAQVKEAQTEARAQSRKPALFRIIDTLGWSADKQIFSHPNKFLAPQNQNVLTFLEHNEFRSKFVVRGSLAQWKNTVGLIARGNSRIIFGLALALTGPLLPLLGKKHFIVSLLGEAECGKSTIAAVASLCWGCHRDGDRATDIGACEIFTNTLAKLDVIFAAHHHMFLGLDETRTNYGGASKLAELLQQMIMRHSLGQGMGRYNEPDGVREFCVPIIVTTNKSLRDLEHGSKVTFDQAHFSRWLEVQAPCEGDGMFEDLHDHKTKGTFCAAIKEAAIDCAGTPAVSFLMWLQSEATRNLPSLQNDLKNLHAAHLNALRDLMSTDYENDKLERAAVAFASIWTAGIVAIWAGVFPFTEDEIAWSVQSCFRSYLGLLHQSDQASAEAADYARAIYDFGVQYEVDLPVAGSKNTLVEGVHDHAQCQGYWFEIRKGVWELLLSGRQFETLVSALGSALDAKDKLAEVGAIAFDGPKGSRRFSVKRTIGLKVDGTLWREQMIGLPWERIKKLAM